MQQLNLFRVVSTLFVFLLSLSWLTAATISVTTTDDDGPGSLRNAVAQAADGDTIRFNSQVIYRTITLASEIVIDKGLYIRGVSFTSTTIDAGGAGRAFNVTTSQDVYIGLMTIMNGTTAESGGAVLNAAGQLHLDGVRIMNCTAGGTGVGNGGGAVASGGRLLVTNSRFLNNEATGEAGSGGAILSTGGGCAVTETIFMGNTSTRAGGAIEISGDVASSSLLNFVTMDDNRTGAMPGNGGGVHITGPSNLFIKGGAYTNNQAAREGGALWNGSGRMFISRALIQSNTASGDAADDGGGGIFNNGGSLVVNTGTRIIDNVADGEAGSGGGIFNAEGGRLRVSRARIMGNTANRAGGGIEDASGTDGSFTVANTTINDNEVFTSPGNGGGIHITGPGDCRVVSGTISNNRAGAEGGGFWNGSGNSLLLGVTITGNTASGNDATQGGGGVFNNGGGGSVRIDKGTISGNVADGDAGSGGGIHNAEGGSLELLNVTVRNNTANRAGGGIEDASGAGTPFILSAVTIDSNEVFTAPGNGGGIHVGGDGNISVRSGSFGGNKAGAEGGAIWIATGTLSVGNNVVFEGNEAAGDEADQGGGALYSQGGGRIVLANGTQFTGNLATGDSGSGGAILNGPGASLTVNSATFRENTANRAGGAIEDVSGAEPGFGVRVLGSLFERNTVGTSPGNGGAIHITGDGDMEIVGSEFNENTAGSEGGAVWNSLGLLQIRGGTTFSRNVAAGDDADNGGGAIFNNGGSTIVVDAAITDNEAAGASGSGGGVLSTGGTLRITGSVLMGNSASRAGGAVEQIDGSFASIDNEYLDNATGAAPGNGGAVHVTGMMSRTAIIGGQVSGNTAANEGGGLWSQAGSTMNVGGVAIMDNSVTGTAPGDAGGGLFNNGGILNVTGSTVAGNQVMIGGTAGGGIFNKAGGQLTLTRSTVAANRTGGTGGGLANNGTLTILNSTIAQNTADSGGGIAQDSAMASLTITGTILAENTATGGTGVDYLMNAGSMSSGGFNLVGNNDEGAFMATADDILDGNAALGDLMDNGGDLMTLAPGCDGDAVDAGDPNDASPDQLGQAVVNARDIGAFEVQTPCMSGLPAPDGSLLPTTTLLDEVNVYPNPVSGSAINVVVPGQIRGEVTLRLIDANGRVRFTRRTAATGQLRLPLADIPNGPYTLQILHGDAMVVRRIIRQR